MSEKSAQSATNAEKRLATNEAFRFQVWASEIEVRASGILVKLEGVVRQNGEEGIVATCFDYATVKDVRRLARDLYAAAREAEAEQRRLSKRAYRAGA